MKGVGDDRTVTHRDVGAGGGGHRRTGRPGRGYHVRRSAAELTVTTAGAHGVRVTLKPWAY